MLYREVVVDIRTRSMFGHQQVRFVGDWRVYPNECIGGWWTRPANWAANTAIASVGIIAITYGIWRVSASLEVCSVLARIKGFFTNVLFSKDKNGTTQSANTFNASTFFFLLLQSFRLM